MIGTHGAAVAAILVRANWASMASTASLIGGGLSSLLVESDLETGYRSAYGTEARAYRPCGEHSRAKP